MGSAFAGNTDLFNLNEDQLQNEFSELIHLEKAVDANPALTLETAISNNLVGDSFMAANALNNMQSDFVFQWEGFLWGFLCCPIGFFVVAVNKNKSKDNKISFWIGFAASSVLGTITQLASGGYYYSY